MGPPLIQVDAFADRPFAGNPAAVCLLDGPADAGWMQSVAGEMNLSETAFLHPDGDAYALRWFTPVAEVALCGHATLASAHALWEAGRVAPGAAIAFATLSGTLTADRDGDLIRITSRQRRRRPTSRRPGSPTPWGSPSAGPGAAASTGSPRPARPPRSPPGAGHGPPGGARGPGGSSSAPPAEARAPT